MRLQGSKGVLLADHPDRITYGTGMRQPDNIESARRQLELLIDAVSSYFRNECPELKESDLEDPSKITVVCLYQRAEALVKEHGSLHKIQELYDELDQDHDYIKGFGYAIEYLKGKGKGSENIKSLRDFILREEKAKERVIDGVAEDAADILRISQGEEYIFLTPLK